MPEYFIVSVVMVNKPLKSEEDCNRSAGNSRLIYYPLMHLQMLHFDRTHYAATRDENTFYFFGSRKSLSLWYISSSLTTKPALSGFA